MPPPELRVIIVEDESRMRDLLAEVIPEMGFPVAATRSAEEALRVMTAQPHEVAIIDLELPGMGGMDLFDTINQRWPTTQVIVLSGFGDLEAARRAIHLNVVDFLSKPCHLRDIEVALDRARRRVEEGATVTDKTAPEVADNRANATLADVEKREILQALDRNAGNRTRTAVQLGISRRKLHYRLAQYGITG